MPRYSKRYLTALLQVTGLALMKQSLQDKRFNIHCTTSLINDKNTVLFWMNNVNGRVALQGSILSLFRDDWTRIRVCWLSSAGIYYQLASGTRQKCTFCCNKSHNVYKEAANKKRRPLKAVCSRCERHLYLVFMVVHRLPWRCLM